MSEKAYARAAVARAIKRGQLMRPSRCDECGEKPERGSDGRATVHAHHHQGYDQPLSVRWLCPTCHFQHDPRPSRMANGRAKLTEAAVVEIRASSQTKALAAKFGVTRATIQRARAGTNWIDEALR